MDNLGDDIRSKFNHETLQLNFDLGSTRKALLRGFFQKHHYLDRKHSIYK